jgi:hypothetical protein
MISSNGASPSDHDNSKANKETTNINRKEETTLKGWEMKDWGRKCKHRNQTQNDSQEDHINVR